MQYYYGDKTPLRVLDEIELWKQQESEHTVVISQIVDNLEREFVQQLKEWELAFSQAEGNAVRYIETIIRSKGAISPELCERINMRIMERIRTGAGEFLLLFYYRHDDDITRDGVVTVQNNFTKKTSNTQDISFVLIGECICEG